MNKLNMMFTAIFAGLGLGVLADYCALPWYLRLPAYLAMGTIVGGVWK